MITPFSCLNCFLDVGVYSIFTLKIFPILFLWCSNFTTLSIFLFSIIIIGKSHSLVLLVLYWFGFDLVVAAFC